MATGIQILEKAVDISHRKDMNPAILLSAIGK